MNMIRVIKRNTEWWKTYYKITSKKDENDIILLKENKLSFLKSLQPKIKYKEKLINMGNIYLVKEANNIFPVSINSNELKRINSCYINDILTNKIKLAKKVVKKNFMSKLYSSIKNYINTPMLNRNI